MRCGRRARLRAAGLPRACLVHRAAIVAPPHREAE